MAKWIVKVKLQDRVVTLKEERTLMTRFIIASRKRPDMNLKWYLGNYEFSVVPQSMFSSIGQLLLEASKATVMHKEEIIHGIGLDVVNTEQVIQDGISIVNFRTLTNFLQRLLHWSTRSFGLNYLMCLIWKSSHLHKPTSPPDHENYGWEMKDDTYIPIMTDQLPATEVVIEMSLCKCKKGCNTMRCKCHKNGLGCTEMCLCENYENTDDERDHLWSDEEEEDEG